MLYGMSLSFAKPVAVLREASSLRYLGKNKSNHERSIDESDVESIELQNIDGFGFEHPSRENRIAARLKKTHASSWVIFFYRLEKRFTLGDI